MSVNLCYAHFRGLLLVEILEQPIRMLKNEQIIILRSKFLYRIGPWYRKRPLCHVSHNQCDRIKYFGYLPDIKIPVSRFRRSVTRWQDYLFNIWPFKTKKKFAKVDSKFCPIKSQVTLKLSTTFITCQSGEISPNLVTLFRRLDWTMNFQTREMTSICFQIHHNQTNKQTNGRTNALKC